jgi:hypothetical protein
MQEPFPASDLSFFLREPEWTSVGPRGIFEWIGLETIIFGDAFPRK